MAQKLREFGYEEVYALEGGFDAWQQAGYPDVPRLGGMDELPA